MMTRSRAAFLMIAASLGRTTAGADEPAAKAEPIVVTKCEVSFERSSLLGSALTGVLGEVLVKPGDTAKAGQVLARLVDRDVRAELEMKAAEAASEIDIQLSEAHLAQAQAKLRRALNLGRQTLVSAEDLEILKTDTRARSLDVEVAKHRRELARLQEKQAQTAVRDREIVAPFDGVVSAVLKAQGESVSANDPIVRVVDEGHLLVTGHLDIVDAWKVRPGRKVRVHPEVAGGELAVESQSFEGRVTFLDGEVHRDYQTVKIVAEVANRDGLLRAGMEARMEILAETVETPPAPR